MLVTFAVDTEDSRFAQISKIMNGGTKTIAHNTPYIEGTCSACQYWQTANEEEGRAGSVLWGRCSRLGGAAVNGKKKQCGCSKEVKFVEIAS